MNWVVVGEFDTFQKRIWGVDRANSINEKDEIDRILSTSMSPSPKENYNDDIEKNINFDESMIRWLIQFNSIFDSCQNKKKQFLLLFDHTRLVCFINLLCSWLFDKLCTNFRTDLVAQTTLFIFIVNDRTTGAEG